ncbi:hypothetical protein ACNFBR_28155 [Pseudomonas sp. NY11955]|uniref:hypothetical protein n=1 Tax=Pseudomonas sp. NY11955 TaxID=3400363 RepID=UPI003A893625
MHDWGAIVAIDGAQINSMLEQQFLAAFDDQRFILPVEDSFALDESQTEFLTLSNVVLGPPRLSFEGASMANANAKVTLPILTGSVVSSLHYTGRPPRLNYSMNLHEHMGYQLSMTVTLQVQMTDVSSQGRLTLNLAESGVASCNLGLTGPAALLIGGRIKSKILEQSSYRRNTVAATLDFSDFGPLCPVGFTLRTQAHPEGQSKDSPHAGEGAVVLFCRLKVGAQDGTLPANPATFPYLIPDDTRVDGVRKFNTTVVLNQDLKGLFTKYQPGMLGQLRMPNAQEVGVLEEYDPLDRVLFGSIDPTAGTFNVEPLRSQMQAGQQRQFELNGGTTAFDAAEQSWGAELMQFSTGSKDITQSGSYTSQPKNFRQAQQVVVVSNRFQTPQGEQVRNALIVESVKALELSPRVATWSEGERAITLSSSDSSATIDIAQGEPELGKLTRLGGGVVMFEPYTPEAPIPEVLMQHIVASTSSDKSAEAVVVIFAYPATLTLEPNYVSEIDAAVPIQFALAKQRVTLKDGQSLSLPDPATTTRWAVFGDGSIDQNGLYTPPATSSSVAAVVMAEVNGEPTGYAVIELAEKSTTPPVWRSLKRFELQVRGTHECLANGMQQVEVLVSIETEKVGDLAIPLSPTEMATLKFYYDESKLQLPFVEAGDDGVEPGPDVAEWYVNLARNPFKPRGTPTVLSEVKEDDATKHKRFYFQSTTPGNPKIFAKFTKDGGGEFDSRDKQGTLMLQSLTVPHFPVSEYSITPERMFHNPPPPIGSEDLFSFSDETIDYWTLSCTHLGVPVLFLICKLSAASAVRWESEQVKETYFSYLSYAFNPPGEPVPTQLTIDGCLLAMAEELKYEGLKADFIDNRVPGKGELMICLHRVPDMPYWHDKMAKGSVQKMYRAVLDRGLEAQLYDQEGNLHRLRVNFPGRTVLDSRNALVLNIGAKQEGNQP